MKDHKHDLVTLFKKLVKENGKPPTRDELMIAGASDFGIRMVGGFNELKKLAGYDDDTDAKDETFIPRVLLIDIETSPILAYVWDLFDQNIPVEMIKEDWFIMSYSAKWLGEKKVIQNDCRKKIGDDYKLLVEIKELLDEADVVVGQNSIRFDERKINARLKIHKIPPPSSYRSVDTLRIAKKKFGFTSHKLGYVTDKLNTKYKKLDHSKFAGNKLWLQCLAGNKKAWDEMKKYNIHDVLALEEYYNDLDPWHSTINFNAFAGEYINKCSCGSSKFIKHGYQFTNGGRYQRYRCIECGKIHLDKTNLLSKVKKSALKTFLH